MNKRYGAAPPIFGLLAGNLIADVGLIHHEWVRLFALLFYFIVGAVLGAFYVAGRHSGTNTVKRP